MKKNNAEMREKKKFNNKLCYLLLSFHSGVSTLSDLAVQFFFKDNLKLEPGSMSRVLSIILIPWMLKPLLGLLTDTCPLFGYRRKYYILICGAVDIICWLLMAFYVNTVFQATCLLFIINTCLAFSTVLGEALVVELSRMGDKEETHVGDTAKDYISMFFIVKDIGALASSYLKGYFIDIMTIKMIFLISASTPILIIIAGFFVVEGRRGNTELIIKKDEEHNKLLSKDTESAPDSQEYSTSSIEKENKNLSSRFFEFVCQGIIIVPTMFIIIFMAVPAYDDPLFYYLTNHLHFSGNIMGQLSFISALTATLAIVFYKFFFKHVGFKVMITIGSFLYSLFSFSAFILVTEYNKKLGISDYLTAIFSSATTAMIGEFIMMPILSLACLLSPKDLEATVYSLFMSAINFGGIISYLQGSYLTSFYGITSNDFKGLPKLILTANFAGLLPLFLLLFIDDKYFHPETKQIIEEKPVENGNGKTLESPSDNKF